jgi:uncharacterized membrane protein HdeD (DUF308 family)
LTARGSRGEDRGVASGSLATKGGVVNEPQNVRAIVGKRATTFGVIALILGILAMLAPMVVGFSIVMLIGIAVATAGLVRMIWAFQSGDVGTGILRFAVGLLTLFCGFVLFAHPLFGGGLLTILLAAYFFADGFFEAVVGWKSRPADGWGWWVFSGVLSILLGVLMLQQFPWTGVWALGFLLGIKLVLIGILMIRGGKLLKAMA